VSEAQLFSTMSFPQIYERVLVGPLFRPFAEQLVTRLGEPGRAELAGRIAVESEDLVARHTRDGVFVLPLATNVAIAHL